MSDKYLSLLRRYWGYSDFRGIQREIIDSICSGHDTLGLMPTGGGKSITFQVPALSMDGVCIVITPLIALMRDQVDHLRHRGIAAAAIYSGMTRSDILTRLDNCILGSTKLLYVSPERLSSELFQVKLRHMRVSFITVDEAHCISQWGYDFRPSYLQIAQIRHLVPGAHVLALTATATEKVVGDIQEKLEFSDGRVFRMSFQRKNLAYVVRETDDKEQELIHILSNVDGPAIVYTRSRRDTKVFSKALNKAGISATYYHAGLDPELKNERQTAWQTDKVRVMVATNAFGMGIDKPDVRAVVHTESPSSLEEYFQEAGRAGRDGEKSYAVLLSDSDTLGKLKMRVMQTFPKKEYVRSVYEHLAYFYQIGVGSGMGATFQFDIERFCRVFHFFPVQVNSSLEILKRAGYIDYDPDPDNAARVLFLLRRDQLSRVEGLSGKQTQLITALLRSYGGLFTEYVYIHEAFLASEAGMTEHEVYEILKGLSQRGILSFIPRSHTPMIRYARDRVDGEEVELSPEVYDDRLSDFQARLNAMYNYISTHDRCRSEMLLEYFGEKQKEPCGICDYCVGEHTHVEAEQLSEQILKKVADGEVHSIDDFYSIGSPHDTIDEALSQLLNEERIRMQDGKFVIAK